MVLKYRIGKIIQTDAVVKEIPCEKKLPEGFGADEKKNICIFQKRIGEYDKIYGLGENVRGINKRGWKYKSECLDNPNHREDTVSMYCAHNFFIIDGNVKSGYFLDTPGVVSYDMCYEKSDEIRVEIEGLNVDIYIIDGDSLTEIIKQFREIIGKSYIPPKWALGYQQSRWGYASKNDVREVVRQYREGGIPLDGLYLDIDYMERYKDFTINEESFSNFPEFVEEMKKEKVHLVPIIDAGVKVEEGYALYEEGVEKDYFCKDSEGGYFTAGVWPGYVHFPDFLREEVREWFGSKYQFLLDMGIDGFWNDMNEPAFFYRKQRLDAALPKVQQYIEKNLDGAEFFEMLGELNQLTVNHTDYPYMLHCVEGKVVSHDKVHNIYGYMMTRAAGEMLEKLRPDKRILLFSRSSYIGMHRYGGMWQGDNLSWWSHLLMNIKMMPSLNMCGFLYAGADLGGFGADVTEDLMLRWIAFGIFTPLMRNHATQGTRLQELYQFSKKDVFRKLITIRYSLIPYLYSELVKCAENCEMMFQPIGFQFDEDKRAAEIEDQLFVGESIMIAPVYQQNMYGRYVYLPEDMIMIRMKSSEEIRTYRMEKGDHYIEIPLDEVVFFLRKGKLIPFVRSADTVEELDETNMKLLGWENEAAEYELYQDDGFTMHCDTEGRWITICRNPDGSIISDSDICFQDMTKEVMDYE